MYVLERNHLLLPISHTVIADLKRKKTGAIATEKICTKWYIFKGTILVWSFNYFALEVIETSPNFVFLHHIITAHDVMSYLICIIQKCTNCISGTRQDIRKRKTPSFFKFTAFHMNSNCFSFRRHFTVLHFDRRSGIIFLCVQLCTCNSKCPFTIAYMLIC